MGENINEGLDSAAECIDGYGKFFTVTSSFKHSFVIERAFDVACKEKRTSKTMVILACLLGKYNLQRFIDNFEEDDWNWIHEKNLDALRKRNAARDAERAIEDAEKSRDRLTEQIDTAKKAARKNK